MGPIPTKNLSTSANILTAQCASPAQKDTSLPPRRQVRSRRRYSRAPGVRTMLRRCTSDKSVPRRGASAFGDARDAPLPSQAKHSQQQASQDHRIPRKETRPQIPWPPQSEIMRLAFVLSEETCILEPHSKSSVRQMVAVNHPAMKLNFSGETNFYDSTR